MIGVEDSRTKQEKLIKIGSKLDLFEVLLTTTWVNKKYVDDSVGAVEATEVTDDVAEQWEGETLPGTAAVDVTLNLDSDFFRAIRIDRTEGTFRYSFICQVDFDNIVIDETLSERDKEYDSMINRIKTIGEGNQKAEAEKKYLLNGGKGA